MPLSERIHNGPTCNPLYFPSAANDFSYKTLQAFRWEKELVEYSRRLEEAAVVGRADVCRGSPYSFWPVLFGSSHLVSGDVRGVRFAVLLAPGREA